MPNFLASAIDHIVGNLTPEDDQKWDGNDVEHHLGKLYKKTNGEYNNGAKKEKDTN